MNRGLQTWWIERRGGYETLNALRNHEQVTDRGRAVLDTLRESEPYYGRLYRGALYEHDFNTPVCTSLNDEEARDYGQIQYIIDVEGVNALEFNASSESEVLLDSACITETMRSTTKRHGRTVTYIWITARPQ